MCTLIPSSRKSILFYEYLIHPQHKVKLSVVGDQSSAGIKEFIVVMEDGLAYGFSDNRVLSGWMAMLKDLSSVGILQAVRDILAATRTKGGNNFTVNLVDVIFEYYSRTMVRAVSIPDPCSLLGSAH
jgi:hypothetical protein